MVTSLVFICFCIGIRRSDRRKKIYATTHKTPEVELGESKKELLEVPVKAGLIETDTRKGSMKYDVEEQDIDVGVPQLLQELSII